MTNKDDAGLNALLFGGESTLLNVKGFVGDGPFTEDDLRHAVKEAITQRRSGTAHISESFNDDAQKIDIRAVVASLQS